MLPINITYVSKFTVSFFLLLRGSLVVEVDSKIYTQQYYVVQYPNLYVQMINFVYP